MTEASTKEISAARGAGDPNAEGGDYSRAVGALYAVAYTLKMSKLGDHRIDGYYDYVVPPLEVLEPQFFQSGDQFPFAESADWKPAGFSDTDAGGRRGLHKDDLCRIVQRRLDLAHIAAFLKRTDRTVIDALAAFDTDSFVAGFIEREESGNRLSILTDILTHAALDAERLIADDGRIVRFDRNADTLRKMF